MPSLRCPTGAPSPLAAFAAFAAFAAPLAVSLLGYGVLVVLA
jgi:hypothetical protein